MVRIENNIYIRKREVYLLIYLILMNIIVMSKIKRIELYIRILFNIIGDWVFFFDLIFLKSDIDGVMYVCR